MSKKSFFDQERTFDISSKVGKYYGDTRDYPVYTTRNFYNEYLDTTKASTEEKRIECFLNIETIADIMTMIEPVLFKLAKTLLSTNLSSDMTVHKILFSSCFQMSCPVSIGILIKRDEHRNPHVFVANSFELPVYKEN